MFQSPNEGRVALLCRRKAEAQGEGGKKGWPAVSCDHWIFKSLALLWFRLFNSFVDPDHYCQCSNPASWSQDCPMLLSPPSPQFPSTNFFLAKEVSGHGAEVKASLQFTSPDKKMSSLRMISLSHIISSCLHSCCVFLLFLLCDP